MKEVAFNSTGEPEVLEVMELPDPEISAGEDLIRVHAAAVSSPESMRRAGLRAQSDDGSLVVGMDAAGIIEAIDADADTDLTVGDQVMAFIIPYGTHGGYAQRVVVFVNSIALIPKGATFAEASTLPMNGLKIGRASSRERGGT